MNENIIEELIILCNLELSILRDGKINPDEDGHYECEKDQDRLKGFYKLVDKYYYGWYIAEQSKEDQIKSINEFKNYIIDHA